MSRTKPIKSSIREAVVAVADKVARGEVANLNETLIEESGGPYEYVLAAYESKMRGDIAAVERNARSGSMNGAQLVLDIPGMEHAAVPFWVKVKDPETGEWLGVSPLAATLDQIDVEVAKLEQKAAVQTKIVAGYRATVDRLRELGVDGSTVGADIAAQFPREIEG